MSIRDRDTKSLAADTVVIAIVLVVAAFLVMLALGVLHTVFVAVPALGFAAVLVIIAAVWAILRLLAIAGA